MQTLVFDHSPKGFVNYRYIPLIFSYRYNWQKPETSVCNYELQAHHLVESQFVGGKKSLISL
jgi:hypothetical protein